MTDRELRILAAAALLGSVREESGGGFQDELREALQLADKLIKEHDYQLSVSRESERRAKG